MAEAVPAASANPLSEREMEVASLLVTGASNAEIARALVISPHTVKVHLRNIFEKLQVSSRTEASMLLLQRGWLVVPGVVVVPPAASAVEPAALLPEPAPLADLPPQVAHWQRIYLAGALGLCLLLFLAPYVAAWMRAPADLLTHAGQVAGSPSLKLDSRWLVRTPLRQPTSRHAMALYQDRPYVLGGETTGGVLLDTVVFLDPEQNSWVAAPALPEPLANLAAAPFAGRLFVAGGSRPQPTNSPLISDQLLAYTQESGTWEVVGRLPYPVSGAGLVAGPDGLYLVGGWDGNSLRSEVWKLVLPDLPGQTPTWELVGQLARGRAFLGAAVAGHDLYVAGGYDGEQELKLFEKLNLKTGRRVELAPMASARAGLALVFDGAALYALGGGWKTRLVNLERYDLATGSWSNFASPVEREWHHLAAVALDGQLLVTGGWAGTYLDNQLQYQSSFRALLPVISND